MTNVPLLSGSGAASAATLSHSRSGSPERQHADNKNETAILLATLGLNGLKQASYNQYHVTALLGRMAQLEQNSETLLKTNELATQQLSEKDDEINFLKAQVESMRGTGLVTVSPIASPRSPRAMEESREAKLTRLAACLPSLSVLKEYVTESEKAHDELTNVLALMAGTKTTLESALKDNKKTAKKLDECIEKYNNDSISLHKHFLELLIAFEEKINYQPLVIPANLLEQQLMLTNKSKDQDIAAKKEREDYKNETCLTYFNALKDRFNDILSKRLENAKLLGDLLLAVEKENLANGKGTIKDPRAMASTYYGYGKLDNKTLRTDNEMFLTKSDTAFKAYTASKEVRKTQAEWKHNPVKKTSEITGIPSEEKPIEQSLEASLNSSLIGGSEEEIKVIPTASSSSSV